MLRVRGYPETITHLASDALREIYLIPSDLLKLSDNPVRHYVSLASTIREST